MMTSVIRRQGLLSLATIRMGRLVLNVDEPLQDYCDPDDEPEVVANAHQQYNELIRSEESAGFGMALTGIVSTSFNRETRTSLRLSAEQVTKYHLSNSGLWFQEAILTEKVRRWIERAIDDGNDIYVVVGYHTLLNARIDKDTATGHDFSSRAIAPLSTSLATVGFRMPVARLADPCISGTEGNGGFGQKHYTAPGEQICAIQYRRVRFKWHSSRDLSRATLEMKSTWNIKWDVRGHDGGTNDVLEADLVDDLEMDDNRKGRLIEGVTFLL